MRQSSCVTVTQSRCDVIKVNMNEFPKVNCNMVKRSCGKCGIILIM